MTKYKVHKAHKIGLYKALKSVNVNVKVSKLKEYTLQNPNTTINLFYSIIQLNYTK